MCVESFLIDALECPVVIDTDSMGDGSFYISIAAAFCRPDLDQSLLAASDMFFESSHANMQAGQ